MKQIRKALIRSLYVFECIKKNTDFIDIGINIGREIYEIEKAIRETKPNESNTIYKKAILRSFIDGHGKEDEIVDVFDGHDFEKNTDATTPFSMHENQFIIPLDSLTKKELIDVINQL